jgi:hypothetical protein
MKWHAETGNLSGIGEKVSRSVKNFGAEKQAGGTAVKVTRESLDPEAQYQAGLQCSILQ